MLAAEPSVGIVTRVENMAEVVSAGGSTAAVVGTVRHLKKEPRSGADARLQVTFRDSTTLTLGEKANFCVHSFELEADTSKTRVVHEGVASF